MTKRISEPPLASDAFRELRVSVAGTQFSVWAPSADAVRLLFYRSGEGGAPVRCEPMRRCEGGMWRVMLEPRLQGWFYAFQARFGRNWAEPVPGLAACAVGANGRRGAVADIHSEALPPGWERDKAPVFAHPADAVVYELHHRDFSMSPDSGIAHKGCFLALTERGTRTPQGLCSGLDHLRELGVTHVHLLPSFDFASVDESRPRDWAYNWGYDPQNYFVPEGSYATDAAAPLCRLLEFRRMVMALHAAGLRVVMDMVFNHTYAVEGGNFECLVPGYFYRRRADGSLSNGSGCGNETASERAGMRRFMVDCLCHWMRDYHVDGFRFDVMGLHDLQTMREVTAALRAIDPAVLLYGEGWSAGQAALPPEECCVKANMSRLPGVAAFGDELRDGLRGEWTDRNRGGFLCGRRGFEESVKFGIVGGVAHPQVDCCRVLHTDQAWAAAPSQLVNYVSCHDDWTLADRLRAVAPEATTAERLRMCSLAYAVLLTSQGIPFLLSGEEFFRTRRGCSNPYNAPDEVNAVRWTDKYVYKALFDYVREMLLIRRLSPLFRLRSAADVRRCLEFLPAERACVVACRLRREGGATTGGGETFYLLFNGNADGCSVAVPRGDYTVLCRDGQACARGLGRSRGGRVKVAGCSALILRAR